MAKNKNKMITLRNLYYKIKFYLFGVSKEPIYDKTNSYIYDYFKTLSVGKISQNKRWRNGLPWEHYGVYKGSDPKRVFIKDNKLNLVVDWNKDYNCPTRGLLYSNFDIKHGIFRIRAKVSSIDGIGSALWTFGDNGMPEIDILETCGQRCKKISNIHHWGYDYEKKLGKTSTLNNSLSSSNFKPSEEFYVYEIEFTPYKIIWRINGVVTKVEKRGIPTNKQHLILSVCQSERCGNSKFENLGIYPSGMEVDWVEVIKYK